MTASTQHTDLGHWLDQATAGLSHDRAVSARSELTAHFEDAVADLVQQGIPQTTAIERALAAMGDPQPVMRGFNDVHRGQHHYKAGMVASLMLMLVIFGFHQLHAALGLTEYSTLSRLFYVFRHSLNTALVCYIVVIAARRRL